MWGSFPPSPASRTDPSTDCASWQCSGGTKVSDLPSDHLTVSPVSIATELVFHVRGSCREQQKQREYKREFRKLPSRQAGHASHNLAVLECVGT